MKRLLCALVRREPARNTIRHLSGARGGPTARTTAETPASSSRPIKTSCANKQDTCFKIIKDTATHLHLDKRLLAGSNIELDDLELTLDSGERLSFNLTWLRDSCHCSSCTHKHSRQRLLTPKDFNRTLFELDEVTIDDRPNGKPTGPSATYSDSSQLHIKWADGHESQYSLDWLKIINNLYKSSRLKNLMTTYDETAKFLLPRDGLYSSNIEGASHQEAWDVAKFQEFMRPVVYADLIDGFKFHDGEPTFINANDISSMTSRRFESMLCLTQQLATFGLAKIINVPEHRNQVLRVARSLAYERPTGYGTVFDVVVEPSEEINLAYSSQEFDLHSDLTYREMSPGVQLLHCIKNSDEGGVSYFSDSLKAAHELRRAHPQLFEVLLQFPAVFVVRDPYRNVCFRRQKPVLALDFCDGLKEVYYSPFMLPPVGFKDDLKLFYLALDKFTQILQSKENKLMVKMDPGDLFIFHNRRVLHGRSSYNPAKGNRFLQGCYMDWDEISCLFEKLLNHKTRAGFGV